MFCVCEVLCYLLDCIFISLFVGVNMVVALKVYIILYSLFTWLSHLEQIVREQIAHDSQERRYWLLLRDYVTMKGESCKLLNIIITIVQLHF